MIDVDMVNEIAALFHIHKEALGHPSLSHIRDSALAQLKEFNDKLGAMKQDLASASEPEEEDEVEEPKKERRV